MNKKTKLLLGVGIVAAAAYYFWNKSNKKETTSFASVEGGCRQVFGKSASGKSPMVFEICPNKPPRIVRGIETYN